MLREFNQKKPTVLYCAAKNRMLNAFVGKSFKKHTIEIINNRRKELSSKIFFHLPSTTDLKKRLISF